MSPFAALGLDEDADERAVKRAYALRLRTVRPDEDAEGFQALNSAYKAALGAVRWRERAEVEDSAPDVSDPQPEAARLQGDDEARPDSDPVPDAPLPEPMSHTPVPDLPPADPTPVEVPERLFDYAAPRPDGGIEFDFDAFMTDLFAVGGEPSDLRAWLHGRMATWPLAMKPTLAPYILDILDNDDIAISPAHLATIIAAFGFDDVLSRVDPLAVEQLRKANQTRWAKHEGSARARRLLAPENRRELSKAVRVAGYPPLVAPAFARILTSPNAARWSMLRWVPPLPRSVMNLLRYISADAVDALSPPIDPIVLARWQSAERLIGGISFVHIISVVMVAVVIAIGVAKNSKDSPIQLSSIIAKEGVAPQRAIEDYTDFIAAHTPPRTNEVDVEVAIAIFNRSLVLRRLDRTEEAQGSYLALEDSFASSNNATIQLLVAKSMLNRAFLDLKAGNYRQTITLASTLLDRYGWRGDSSLDQDSFDLLVVKALSDQADAWNRLGNNAAAAAICKSVLERFKNETNETMNDSLEYLRRIERESVTGETAPPKPSFSFDGFRKPEQGPDVPTIELPR